MQSNTVYKRCLYTGVIIISQMPMMVVGEEFSAFRMTGVEGNIVLQHVSDEQTQGQAGDAKARNALSTTDEEVNFLTHSYVYHPNLLNIDFGAGVIFTQNIIETRPADTSTEPPASRNEYDDQFYNLTARLNFLEKKPYPFSLYYDRSYPTVSASVTERFVYESEKYGLNAAILEPLLPFSMNLEASHQNQDGQGSTQILNNQTDTVLWRAYSNFGDTGYGQVTAYNNHYYARNGVIDTKGDTHISEQDITSESVSIDTNFDYGARRQVNFNNLLSYYRQDNLPLREEYRWTPNVSWRHTDKTSSYYRYDYFDTRVEKTQSLSQTGAVDVRTELTDTVAVSGGLQGARTKTEAYQHDSRGVNGNITYTQPLSFGKLQLGAGSRYDENTRDDHTSSSIATKIAEVIRLNGVEKVALAIPHVIAVTRVVNDKTGVVLTENVDYKVELPPGGIGTAYIWSLGSSALDSKDTVRVDYQYKIGGSTTYTSLTQSYNAQLDFLDYYAIYFSYADTETAVKDGRPEIPPSSTAYTRTGARVDHPFFQDDLILGGEVNREEMEDDYSPYIRKSYDTYIETRFVINTRLRLSNRRVIQDNLRTPEDVDLTRQSARLTMHPFPRSSLSLEVIDEKDTGGSLTRRIREKAITGNWQIRKLLITLDGRSIIETYGSSEREHNIFMARLSREF